MSNAQNGQEFENREWFNSIEKFWALLQHSDQTAFSVALPISQKVLALYVTINIYKNLRIVIIISKTSQFTKSTGILNK